jgi:ABC-type multidrug transport system fused ATPase/permease subunit
MYGLCAGGCDLATTVEEDTPGIRVLKSFGHGSWATRIFLAQARELRRTELTKVRVLATLWTLIITLPELTLAAMLAIGGYAVAAGSLSLGTVVGAVTILTCLHWPLDSLDSLDSLGWLLAEAGNATAATARYWEVRDTVRAVADPPQPRPPARPVRGALRLEGVRFRYPGAAAEALRGVDLDVRPGETVALVGATGSGKTTLTALIPRLADVTGGRVLVDGVDVRDPWPAARLTTASATARGERRAGAARRRSDHPAGRSAADRRGDRLRHPGGAGQSARPASLVYRRLYGDRGGQCADLPRVPTPVRADRADVLLDLRERVFAQVQRLSLAFHERCTSGRVISRLTSDLNSLQEMLDQGLDEFFISLLSIVGIAFCLLAGFTSTVRLVGSVSVAVTLLFGGLRVRDGSLTLGVLAAFVLYLRQFYDPLDKLAMFANSYASAAAALEKISGVLEERSAVGDPVQPVALPVPVRGEVVFDGVRFSYGGPEVLPRLDLLLNPAGRAGARSR